LDPAQRIVIVLYGLMRLAGIIRHSPAYELACIVVTVLDVRNPVVAGFAGAGYRSVRRIATARLARERIRRRVCPVQDRPPVLIAHGVAAGMIARLRVAPRW